MQNSVLVQKILQLKMTFEKFWCSTNEELEATQDLWIDIYCNV